MYNVPLSRAAFERNLFLLRERLRGGKLYFAPGISVDGILRLRTLPNGRIDLLSVDESTRLLANMAADMAERFPVADPEE